jgi:four helix bundle protein
MEFIYEKLDVWNTAVEFGLKAMKFAADKSEDVSLRSILEELEKSAMNVSMAIAKGKGYPSKHDFAKHLYLARGSVYETMTLLEILKRKQVISDNQYAQFEETGNKVAAMLGGLLKAMYKPSEGKRDQKSSAAK